MSWTPPAELRTRVEARRGRRHAFGRLDATRTALVTIDLTEITVGNDPRLEGLADPIKRAARLVRNVGGVVAWVRPGATQVDPRAADVVGDAAAEGWTADAGSPLWSGLAVDPGDLHARKTKWSAFFPGHCDLHDQLSARGIENLLFAGTVTNVCVEASGRDAVELGYRVVMLHDALVGHSYGLHEASLSTFYRIFGDVRSVEDLADLLI